MIVYKTIAMRTEGAVESAKECSRNMIDVLLPKVGVKVAQLIGDNKQTILDKLRLEQRVTEAVDGMSVATFHETLNEFLSENLCAVQVLGFVLGSIVGALQLMVRF